MALIQPQMVADAIREDTTVVSIMHVNNELGTLNDIAAIGAICRETKYFSMLMLRRAPARRRSM